MIKNFLLSGAVVSGLFTHTFAGGGQYPNLGTAYDSIRGIVTDAGDGVRAAYVGVGHQFGHFSDRQILAAYVALHGAKTMYNVMRFAVKKPGGKGRHNTTLPAPIGFSNDVPAPDSSSLNAISTLASQGSSPSPARPDGANSSRRLADSEEGRQLLEIIKRDIENQPARQASGEIAREVQSVLGGQPGHNARSASQRSQTGRIASRSYK
jgi:hypothetical protein